MRILTLASRKGGAGKTTLSYSLAVAAEQARYGPAVLVDMDEMASLTGWWDARKTSAPALAKLPISGLSAAIPSLEQRGYHLLVIDTSAGVAQTHAEAVGAADLVLVPVQPSGADLRAVGGTLALVERLQRPFLFVLCQVRARSRLTDEAAAVLRSYGPLAEQRIRDFQIYREVYPFGVTAQEQEPESKAAADIKALWVEVAARMERSVIT